MIIMNGRDFVPCLFSWYFKIRGKIKSAVTNALRFFDMK